MPLSEFELIERYFAAPGIAREDVVLGVGDDAALLAPPAGHEVRLAVSTLVPGVDCSPRCAPQALGHRCLALPLGRLAAMGAAPAWATLALTLPEADEQWLAAFAGGFRELALRWQVQLAGGDTTRGPLAVTVFAHGLTPEGEGLAPRGGRAGDLLCVTGALGEAPGAQWQGYGDGGPPQPRLAHGLALRGVASAAADAGRGLLAAVHALCSASGTGATLDADRLPLEAALRERLAASPEPAAVLRAAAGGEIVFTLPGSRRALLDTRLRGLAPAARTIGILEASPGLRLREGRGRVTTLG